MIIEIRTTHSGGCGFKVNQVDSRNNLTFCKMDTYNQDIVSVLLELVKKGIVFAFEPKKDSLTFSVHTKYVENIKL